MSNCQASRGGGVFGLREVRGEDYYGLVVVARMGSMDQVSTGGFLRLRSRHANADYLFVSECGKDGAPTFVSRMARADEGVRCSMSYLVSRCQASS
jgi:hypothetical protein